MRPLISVVIPVYNTENYVVESIYSVLNQTYKNVEIIVVDDGSPDRSAEIIENEFKDSVILLRKENGGVSTARNLALDIAKGEYVTFLDSDDTLQADAIENLYEKIILNSSDIVVPNTSFVIDLNGDKKKLKLFDESSDYMDSTKFAIDHMIIEGTAWRCSSVLYKMSIIKAYHVRFQEGVRLNEDFYFNLSYFAHIQHMAILRIPTLNVKKHLDSATAVKKPDTIDRCMLGDQNVTILLHSVGFDEHQSRAIADKLLIKNIVVFFVKNVKLYTNQYGFHKAIRLLKKEIFAQPEMVAVLKNTTNNKMFFTEQKKKIFAKLIMWLLKLKMFYIAGVLVRAIS